MLDLRWGGWGWFNFGWFWWDSWGPNKQVLYESFLFLGLSYFVIFVLLGIFFRPVYNFFYNAIGTLFFAIPLIIYFWKMQNYDPAKKLKYKLYTISFVVTIVWALAMRNNSTTFENTEYILKGIIPLKWVFFLFWLAFIWLFIWDAKNLFWIVFNKIKSILWIQINSSEWDNWDWWFGDGDSYWEENNEEVELNYPELRDAVKKIFIAKKKAYAEDEQTLRVTPEILPENDAILKGPVTLSARLKIPFWIKIEKLNVVLWDLSRILKKDCSIIEMKEWKKEFFWHWLQISFSEEDLSAMRKAWKWVYFEECFEKYKDCYEENSWNMMFWITPFNDAVIYNIDDLVHLLVWWQTGSWKSVFLHNILLQLLINNSPEKLQVVLVDPKLVTFWMYKWMPHLKYPIVTAEPKKFLDIILELKKEYLKRQNMMDVMKVQKMAEFNKAIMENKQFEIMANLIIGKIKQVVLKQPEEKRDDYYSEILELLEISDFDELEFRLDEESILLKVFELFETYLIEKGLMSEMASKKMVDQLKEILNYKPVTRIIMMVDELADLVMDKEYWWQIMDAFANLAWVCRSAYINLIACTQHPNSTIVPPLLKANLPSAAALKVKMSTNWDIYSRTIIWQDWAAKLIGSWDCLLMPNIAWISNAIRIQTPFANNDFINKTVKDQIEEYGLKDFEDDEFLETSSWFDSLSNDDSAGQLTEEIPVIESPMIDIEKELEWLDSRFLNSTLKSNVWLTPSAIRTLSYWKRQGYIPSNWSKIVNDYPKAVSRDIKTFIKYLVEAKIFVPAIVNWKQKDSELVVNEAKNISTVKWIVIQIDEFLRNYDKNNRTI